MLYADKCLYPGKETLYIPIVSEQVPLLHVNTEIMYLLFICMNVTFYGPVAELS